MITPYQKICVLLSGGLDSALLIQKALEESCVIFPLYVACGFIWEASEQQAIHRLLENLKHPNLEKVKILHHPLQEIFPTHWGFDKRSIPDDKAPDEEVYIPGRNLLLLTEAVLYCEAENLKEIWLGSLQGNPFPDASEAFFEAFSQTSTLALARSLKIKTPFLHFTKAELIARYPTFPYELTLSCLQSQAEKHCGVCNKCEERRSYFKKASIKDPTPYLLE